MRRGSVRIEENSDCATPLPRPCRLLLPTTSTGTQFRDLVLQRPNALLEPFVLPTPRLPRLLQCNPGLFLWFGNKNKVKGVDGAANERRHNNNSNVFP